MQTMQTISAGDRQFWGQSDSKTIQNAIDYAEKTGRGRVIIPRHNERTGENIWNIDKTILLPDNMTLLLEDCHLRLTDNVFENIFRNKNCRTAQGNTMEGEQENIRILGSGNALLDGGNHNGLYEQLCRKEPEKHPLLSNNLLLFFHNVRNFTVSGIQLKNARWWALCFVYCRWGRISDVHFDLYNWSSFPDGSEGETQNMDGVDLRVGCEYITLENITGITGDDTIAMTALPFDDYIPEAKMAVAGKRPHIHDISIRNVRASAHGCTTVRLLCADGAQIYNVLIDGLQDTGVTYCSAPVLLGNSNPTYVKKRPMVMGEMRNITIRNVSTYSMRPVTIAEPVQDVLIENVYAQGEMSKFGVSVSHNAVCKNVLVRNVTLRCDRLDSVLRVIDGADVSGLRLENVYAEKADYLIRGKEFNDSGLSCGELVKGRRTEEPLVTKPYYYLYHTRSFGNFFADRFPRNQYAPDKGFPQVKP